MSEILAIFVSSRAQLQHQLYHSAEAQRDSLTTFTEPCHSKELDEFVAMMYNFMTVVCRASLASPCVHAEFEGVTGRRPLHIARHCRYPSKPSSSSLDWLFSSIGLFVRAATLKG